MGFLALALLIFFFDNGFTFLKGVFIIANLLIIIFLIIAISGFFARLCLLVFKAYFANTGGASTFKGTRGHGR